MIARHANMRVTFSVRATLISKMKKQTFHAAVAALVCLLAVSCSKQKERSSQPKSQTSNSSEPAVELKAKWSPGKKIVQRMTISARNGSADQQSSRGQQVTDMSWDYSVTTLKQSDDGGHELELEFVSTKIEAKAGDRVYMSFDSAHDDGKETKDPFTPAFRKLVGAKVRYVLGPDGKVKTLDGYDDFMVRIARGSKNSEMLKSMFNQEMLKRLCGWADSLPDHPVRPGDTWKQSIDTTLYGTAKMMIEGKFTFATWEEHNSHKCVKLDYTGTISGNSSGSAQVAIDKGTISGSSWFDPEEGVVVASDLDQVLTIKIGQKGDSGSQKIFQNVTLQLVE
jgi:hypothetical protein